MKEVKIKVIQFIRELMLKVDIELENFPKKDIEIKNRIRTSTYDLLELAYESNSTQNITYKQELLNKLIANINGKIK